MRRFSAVLGLSVLTLLISLPSFDTCPHCRDLREDCLEARPSGGGSSGKWVDATTPKRGWACTGAEDIGKGNTIQCEMCEREEIRFVHHMQHGDINPLDFKVGCICAGHMEGRFESADKILESIERAKERNRFLTNRATRREKFSSLSGWKTSKKGNEYLKKDGRLVVIFRSPYGQFSASIDNQKIGAWFESPAFAKVAAFDEMYPALIAMDG